MLAKVPPKRIQTTSLAPEWEDGFPVILHIDHGPALGLRHFKRHVEATNGRVAVVGPFPLGVGVVHDEREANTAASLGPLEHLQVTVGVAESRNRLPADVHLDADR